MNGTEPCPDCKAGKHPNCDGGSWDVIADGPAPCPCQQNNHGHGGALVGVAYPESIGTAVLGEVPQCNGHCNHDGADDDCLIHGKAADQREAPEWCPECGRDADVIEKSIETAGFEEQARDYHVTRLACGHELSVPVGGRR